MASIWVESLRQSFEQALDLLAAAVRDCTDELWETAMWQVPEPDPNHQFLDSDWKPITDSEQRSALVQRWVERRSTPWSVTWHALEGLDYDLNGEFGPWAPPPPFRGHPHWRDLASLPAAWSRAEMLGYVDYCRGRVRDTLANMTEEKAARPLPSAHRYRGQPYARVVMGLWWGTQRSTRRRLGSSTPALGSRPASRRVGDGSRGYQCVDPRSAVARATCMA